jgi:hypothetical protein
VRSFLLFYVECASVVRGVPHTWENAPDIIKIPEPRPGVIRRKRHSALNQKDGSDTTNVVGDMAPPRKMIAPLAQNINLPHLLACCYNSGLYDFFMPIVDSFIPFL